jgi:phosphatidylserine/phosphatidylglycerophosphate/cardiolipin synthase-like enzyme
MFMKTKRILVMILCGAAIMTLGGCKKQDHSELTVAVEGRELSKAEVFIDGKSVGRLTQTIITAEGKIYIDGKLSAQLLPQQREQRDTCSGCTDSIRIKSGEHVIELHTKEGRVIQITADLKPGHRLLTISPRKGSAKLDDRFLQINHTKALVADPQEKD